MVNTSDDRLWVPERRGKTANAMVKRRIKSIKGQIIICMYKTLHKKLKIEQRVAHYKPEVNPWALAYKWRFHKYIDWCVAAWRSSKQDVSFLHEENKPINNKSVSEKIMLIKTLLIQLYVRVDILATRWKHMHDRTISLRREILTHTARLGPPCLYWSTCPKPLQWVVMYACEGNWFCVSFYYYSLGSCNGAYPYLHFIRYDMTRRMAYVQMFVCQGRRCTKWQNVVIYVHTLMTTPRKLLSFTYRHEWLLLGKCCHLRTHINDYSWETVVVYVHTLMTTPRKMLWFTYTH